MQNDLMNLTFEPKIALVEFTMCQFKEYSEAPTIIPSFFKEADKGKVFIQFKSKEKK